MNKFFLSLLIIVVSACGERNIGGPVLSQKLTDNHTMCFGRNLIDLPSDFVWVDGLTAVFSPQGLMGVDGEVNVEVVKAAVSKETFTNLILNRRNEIVKSATNTTGKLRNQRSVDENSKIFTILTIDDAYSTELHALLDGNYIVLKTASYENQFMAAEQRVIDMWRNFEKTTAANMATGYCLGNVLVREEFKQEQADFSFRSAKNPDVKISIETNTYRPDEKKSLLERVDGASPLARALEIKPKVIRKGELKIASMNAQEWLGWIILGEDDKAKKQYGFALETMRAKPSRSQPHIHLELDTGQPSADGAVAETNLTETEIIGLWDSLSRSIRASVNQ